MKTTIRVAGLLFVWAANGFASPIISYGNIPMGDNIVFNGAGTSATDPVVGRVNSMSDLYTFASRDLLKATSSGQARVEAIDRSFKDLAFFSPGNTFTGAVFNLIVYDPPGAAKGSNGTVQFTIGLVGEPDYVSGNFDVSRNGNNFFTIQTADSEKMTKISYTTSTELGDMRQLRIGGTLPMRGEVSEPASLCLTGCGLAFVAYLARRRRAV